MISLLPYHISLTIQRAENILETTLPYDISIALQRAENFVEMTHISIALQRDENIIEMTLPYDISISLPHIYCYTTGQEHRRNDHSVQSLYCSTVRMNEMPRFYLAKLLLHHYRSDLAHTSDRCSSVIELYLSEI